MAASCPALQAPRAPALFISHGSPAFALEPGALGAWLHETGARLSGLQAVLVVSPHWQTRDLRVMTTAKPATVHDFSGFPAALYDLAYPAPGAPHAGEATAHQLRECGWPVTQDDRQGLDHGAWVPLMHLLPQARVPVFQVSLPLALDARGALALGRALAPLRRQGIAVIGSGSMTHNLHEFRGAAMPAECYVTEFSHWVRDAVQARQLAALADYRALAPHARRAHPSQEHFLPLLVALGASDDEDRLDILDGDVRYGMLSMESYGWGLPQGAAATASTP